MIIAGTQQINVYFINDQMSEMRPTEVSARQNCNYLSYKVTFVVFVDPHFTLLMPMHRSAKHLTPPPSCTFFVFL